MIRTVLIDSTQSLNPRRVFAGLWKQSENNVTCDWESQTACQAVVLHHSTTSPTTLLGCWAKFRAGLPPYRSGLVDGKCVWRLSRRVSLTPLCIACLDLTSATSGRDHVTHRSSHRTSASALSGPFSFFFLFFSFFFFDQFFPFIPAYNQTGSNNWNWGKVTEVGPSASDTWLHQSEVESRKDQLAFEKILFFSFFFGNSSHKA